ncbi:MAG: ABC transporter permease subunit [Pirellula sp.]
MTSPPAEPRAYRRKKTSSRAVVWSDRIAKQIITIGGIGTIFVVLLVVLVLLGNVLPLFQGTRLALLPAISLEDRSSDSADASAGALAIGLDEYSEVLWSLNSDQSIVVRSIPTSQVIERFTPKTASTSPITATRVDSSNQSLLLGFADGSVQPITLEFSVTFAKLSELDASLQTALASGPVVHDGQVHRATAGGLVRAVRIASAQYHDPIPVFDGLPIEHIDWRTKTETSGFDASQQWIWAVSSGPQVALGRVEQRAGGIGKKNKSSKQVWKSDAATEAPKSVTRIRGLMLSATGDSVESIDDQGQIAWWKIDGEDRLRPSLSYRTLTGIESEPTTTVPLLGRSTWMIGSRGGHVEGVAVTSTQLGQELLTIHRMALSNSPVMSLAASPSNRILGSLDQSGQLRLTYVPSEQQLAQIDLSRELGRLQQSGKATAPSASSDASNPPSSGPTQLQFSPNGQMLACSTRDRVALISIDCPYPEASWSTFFQPTWYEGYSRPQHIWQSTTGSVEGETKLGMWPLIFGTFKATFYSMLIAAPIALLAAIYGSEFMSRKWRLRFKPLIELMASVPSVVLGFIGAMVVAPFLRDSLGWVLLSILLTLFFFLLAAHLWMLIPMRQAIPLRRYRLPLMFLIPVLGVIGAGYLAEPIERALFATSITDWLSEASSNSWPGWFALWILPMAAVVWWLMSSSMGERFTTSDAASTPTLVALRKLFVFLIGSALVLVLAALLAGALSGIGWDPRGSLLGPYQERNALLVGGIMGFAIIPLIYTLADDALQSVPQHLRSASLGCGATVWQTTVRVVVPTAMSGLFSALMIGFGRAIGETMVVLMAAGNTPLMEVNPFNGYRTLSATLATELPEAARGSTHYHTLFLAALLLFGFTLVANTLAEWVRQRFRKRAYQL